MGVERQLWQHKNRCGWGFRQRQGANTSTSARVVDGVSSLRICPPKSMLWYFSSVVFVLMLLLCVCVCVSLSLYMWHSLLTFSRFQVDRIGHNIL